MDSIYEQKISLWISVTHKGQDYFWSKKCRSSAFSFAKKIALLSSA